jgi:hypothetical protein
MKRFLTGLVLACVVHGSPALADFTVGGLRCDTMTRPEGREFFGIKGSFVNCMVTYAGNENYDAQASFFTKKGESFCFAYFSIREGVLMEISDPCGIWN